MSQATKKRKTETSTPAPAPAPAPAPPATPATAPNPYSVPQGSRTPTSGWSGHPSQIPIDPALQQATPPQPPTQVQPPKPQPPQQQQQQQHPPPQTAQQQQQQYANYYQQYNYAAAGYHPPPAWSAAQARAAPHPSPHPHPPAAQQHQQQSQQPQQPANDLDTADVATLNDALGSAGVDLRAEEENLRQSHATSQSNQPPAAGRRRAKKQGSKPAFDAAHLGTRMRAIAAHHALAATTAVPDDTVAYLALALRARLASLIEGMAAAAAHREDTGVQRPPGMYADGAPMWSTVVRRDVAKQLALLERVEREEELAARRERKAYTAGAAAGGTALPSLDDALPMEVEEEPKKKKKKPDGPGVTAKNMSEDMKKKLSNAVASQAAGLGTGKYAWMNAGNIPSGPPVKKAAGTPTPAVQPGGGWAKPFQSGKKKEETPGEEDTRRAVTLRDAIFVVERERGHGGGRGAARGWT